MEGGVDMGLGGGEALRRKFVRRDAKKASFEHVGQTLGVVS